jgi:PKHD-type hydroxylase
MLIAIPDVLTPDQVAHARRRLDAAGWVDGKVTAGPQSARAKDNLQLAESDPVARELGDLILGALQRNALFISAALPWRIFPPLFNRYQGGQSFGNHVDNAIRQVTGTPHRIRTDLSATLFLSDPGQYDGGDLVIDDNYGMHSVKLQAGAMAVYPSSSLHRVSPVTRGTRVASFFWIQSLVRDDAQRTLLFDLDMAVIRLTQRDAQAPELLGLTGVYHNLLRMWAEP